jgi:hypothetical protein
MSIGKTLRIHRGGGAALLAVLVVLGPLATSANAVAPTIGAVWATSVQVSTARLQAEIDPEGLSTTYHFDYLTKAAYEANLAGSKDGFSGAARVPLVTDANIGAGSNPVTVLQLVFGLSPDTAYNYRVVAKNTATTTGSVRSFVTQGSIGSLLPDGRGWEMVSPIDKNGGQVEQPGAIAAGGHLQAALDGQSVTYGSAASFGASPGGAPPASQYLARRGAGGWSTENVTVPILSGGYDTEDGGVPYRLFSEDLARALLLNGDHCRGEDEGCAVANPPIAGTDAPPGYQNYYLRQSGSGFEALLGAGDIGGLNPGPESFDLTLAGASPDLKHIALSSCGALTADASEVPMGEGCDPAKPNLYMWSTGTGLSLVNDGAPGAVLGAQSAAISADGSRVYWNDFASGNLYLREGSQTEQVDAVAGGGGTFETASANGAIAFFTKAEHLYRYEAATQSATDLTPSGGVQGVLGASASGSHVYYLTGSGVFLRQGATTTKVSDGADSSSYPPASGKARVSADGTRLLFVATAPITGYDNTDLNTGSADSQVYLYTASPAVLTCISCNPTNGRPIGPSTIPGAIANGATATATVVYKPRALSANGRRVFFESGDALVGTDTNADVDVYQWEAQGEGSCTRAGGYIALISSGRDKGGAAFVDASIDGADAFFLTAGSLVGADPGAVDLYDARVGGGFPVPSPPIPCEGDSCQGLLPEPVDPTLTTRLPGKGNPPPSYQRRKHRKRKAKSKVERRSHGKKHGKKQGKGKGRRAGR